MRAAQARVLMALHIPQLHCRSTWQGVAAQPWALVLVLQLVLPQLLSCSSGSSSSRCPCQSTPWACLTTMLRHLGPPNMGLGCAGQLSHQVLLGSALQQATLMLGTGAHQQLQRCAPSCLAPKPGRTRRGRQLGQHSCPSRHSSCSVARLVRQRLWWGQLPGE